MQIKTDFNCFSLWCGQTGYHSSGFSSIIIIKTKFNLINYFNSLALNLNTLIFNFLVFKTLQINLILLKIY